MKLLIPTILASIIAINGCTAPKSETPYPTKVTAVLVGLTYKCDKKELRKKGAELDLITIDECIHQAYNDFNANRPRCHTRVYQDKDATLYNVKSAIRQAMYDDLAIIYFSCKATQIEDTGSEESDGKDECLMLYDGLLKDDDIWNILQYARNRVFIIFDTSNSESLFKANSDKHEVYDLLTDLYDEMMERDKKNVIPLNMVCWSACCDDESIKERGIGSKLTNTIYFKFSNNYLTYDDVFEKLLKTLDGKQNIKKTVFGEDFSDRSMFR